MDRQAGQEKEKESEGEMGRGDGQDAPEAAGRVNRRRASRHDVSKEVQRFLGTIDLPWRGSVMGRMGNGMRVAPSARLESRLSGGVS